VKRLLQSPWPLTLGLLVPLQAALLWVQWQGWTKGVLSRGVMELWVHGPQPALAWVPFIHPPGYSVFMNGVDWSSDLMGVDPAVHILVQGWICRAALVVLVAWAMDRWTGPRTGVFAAALVAFSPNSLRPFEHYPLATLLGTGALVAIIDFARKGTYRSRRIAIIAVLVAVELHLSNWFVIGGTMAAIFFFMETRRRDAAIASAAMIGVFMLTTVPGLWRVLEQGMGNTEEHTAGVISIEWTNPWLLAAAGLVLLPPLCFRAKEAAALAVGVVAFTGVTVALQYKQIADGQPYPYSLHYFELADPAMAICAAWGLWLMGSREGCLGSVLASVAAAGLLITQVLLLLDGQAWVFVNKFWFWAIIWPFGG
jgi:hypothetical protein